MADEEQFLDDDVTGEEEQAGGAKPGFLSGLLLTVLKWAAIGLAAIILVATVSYVTFNLFFKGKQPTGRPQFSPEYQQDDVDMEFFKNMLEQIRGQTADDPPRTFVVNVSIGYVKGDVPLQTELISKTEQIQNMILKFFGQKPSSELVTGNFETLESDLVSKLNNSLLRSGQIKKVLIHELQTF